MGRPRRDATLMNRSTILLGALTLCAYGFGQTSLDASIKTEFQTMMDLLAPSGANEKLDEEAARVRVENFQRRLQDFLKRWELRQVDLKEGRFLYAKALALGGRPADAIPQFEKFVSAHGDSLDWEEAMVSLGSANLDAKRPEAAAQALEKYLSDRPKGDQRHVAMFYLGVAKDQLLRFDEALALFKEVQGSGLETPIVGDAALKSIEILRTLGRVDEAKAILAAALQKDPEAAYLKALEEQLNFLGAEAPELKNVSAWLNGQATALSGLRGRVVVLNFFADRYEACQDELQRLGALAQNRSSGDIAFIGVTKYYRPVEQMPRAQEQRLLQDFLTNAKVAFPVAIAEDVSNLHAYLVRGVPHTVVIDRQGKVAYTKTGGSRKSERSWNDLVAAIDRAAK